MSAINTRRRRLNLARMVLAMLALAVLVGDAVLKFGYGIEDLGPFPIWFWAGAAFVLSVWCGFAAESAPVRRWFLLALLILLAAALAIVASLHLSAANSS